jgi:hypothetical protein
VKERSNHEGNLKADLKKRVRRHRNMLVVLIAVCAILLLIIVSTAYASQVMGWPPAKAHLLV